MNLKKLGRLALHALVLAALLATGIVTDPPDNGAAATACRMPGSPAVVCGRPAPLY